MIALVSTIIVLLILAGVSIAMLTGENGILTQAQRAKEETEQAQANEANILSNYEDSIYEATGDVPQVNDSNPGTLEGRGTEQEPYTINSIEDLVSFADSVTNGNTYQNQYVKLNQSLDFKSDKSYVDPNRENYYGYTGKLKEALTTGKGFKPIGTTIPNEDGSNSFCGYFDGNSKQIVNCYINEDISESETGNRFGFFGANLFGEIKNLGLTEVNYTLVANGQSTGIAGIVFRSWNGKITNCYVTGNISATQNGNASIYSVGLVSANRGTIENCYNLATINGKLTSSDSSLDCRCYCAGIASNNENVNAVIRNCYNTGNIIVESSYGTAEIGGVARVQDSGTIENCYNSGNINYKVNKTIIGSCRIGGIIGQLNDGDFRNVYNSGNIDVLSENQSIYLGGIAGESKSELVNSYNIGTINNANKNLNCITGEILGHASENASTSNSFYINNQPIGINSSTSCVTTKVTSDELKSDNTLNLLNQNSVVWKKDASNVNNGYPILEWQ